MARFKTWKLVVEFRNPEDMLEVWEAMAPTFPERAEPFEADALDMGGRAESGTFIVKSSKDRPFHTSLRRLVEAREEAAQAGGEKARTKIKTTLTQNSSPDED